MSSEDNKQPVSENREPLALKDAELDKVQGGYIKFDGVEVRNQSGDKWKVEEGESLKSGDPETATGSKIVVQSGDGSI